MNLSMYLSRAAIIAIVPIGYANAQEVASAEAQTPSTPTSGLPQSERAEDGSGIQDIVVTAQRRDESLQDVPVSVSAITADALTTTGVQGLETLQMSVPSLTALNSGGQLSLRIRGIGAPVGGPGFENPVALYVDGVYLASQTIGLMKFNNVERIEVLKGPQGTLFGRNATGGVTHIITKDPGQNAEVQGSISYGNYNTIEAKLYAGGPVSSELAADFALYFGRNDGWGTNIFTGESIYKTDHDISARSKIVWKPSDLKFTLIGDYYSRKDSMNPLTVAEGTRIAAGLPPVDYPGAWDANTNLQPGGRARGYGISFRAEGALGSVDISNLISYRSSRFEIEQDFDGSPLPIAATDILQKDWQFADDFQISSKNGAFSWIAGVNYFRSKGSALPIAVVFATDPAFNPILPVGIVSNFGYQSTDSIAGFVQGTLELTDRLRLTAGARYTVEERKLNARTDGTLYNGLGTVIPIVPTQRSSKKFKRPTYRAALDYQITDDILVYASVNTGFKSGGYNVLVPTDPFYEPEKIAGYEIGQKADLFGRTVRLNTAVFYYDYKNVQTQITVPSGTGIINGAKARIYGFEGELMISPSRYFQANAGLVLLDAKFRDFPLAPIGAPGGGIPPVNGNVSGNDMLFAPSAVFNLGGTLTIPVGDNELVANATWLHSTSFYHEADNVAREPSFDKVNASLAYNFDDGRLSIAGFVSNLTNATVRSFILTNPFGQQIQVLQPPRQYGVRASFKF